ncbi:carbohydrate sulfotransferase 11-like isoform X1 [Artemia franciscana]
MSMHYRLRCLIVILWMSTASFYVFKYRYLDPTLKTRKGEIKEDMDIDQWMDNRKILYKERAKMVELACEKFKIRRGEITRGNFFGIGNNLNVRRNQDSRIENPDPSHFAVIRPHKSMACLINKVASTSLASHLLKLNGYEDLGPSPHSGLDRIAPKSADGLRYYNKTFYKFMFVRDPMSRLLSCFHDKIVMNPERNFWFRRHVLQTIRGKELPATKNVLRTTGNEVPSFEEFIQYILEDDIQDKFKSHWSPYWSYCTPCSIQYDMIGKLETNTADFKYLWKKFGWIEPVPVANSYKMSQETKNAYVSSLSREIILRIYKRYQIDYEMFEYDINAVLEVAKAAPLTDQELSESEY